jgi:hypothetical protein
MRRTAWLVLLGSTAFAAAPLITELRPRGGNLSRPFTLTVVGRDLGEGARIWSRLPASFTPVTPPDQDETMKPGRMAAYLVEPKAGVQPGVYPVRIESSTGISNVLLFTVGTYPETAEEESAPYSQPNRNDSIETAEPVQSVPITVNGTLRGAERDLYRVYGKAGEWRVFEVEARRCGSAIDPVLRILDGGGKQLARSEDAPATGLDARVRFTFPREGFYYVEVHDARFSSQKQNFYRLKMGPYAYADGIFPLGGRRGGPVDVALFGSRLASPVKVKADLSKIDGDFTTIALPDSPALPFVFAVGDLPESTEPLGGPLPVPSVVNGRLSEPGEVDRYRLNVEPGEKLLFELQARELGTSRLEGIIAAYDSTGKKLGSGGDQPLPEDVFAVQGTSRTSSDPFLNLTVPEDVRDITVTVEDLALRGGPLYGYRLMIRSQAQDFRLSIASAYVNIPAGGSAALRVTADRRGYDGPIQLSIANPPEGVTVEGGIIPREYVDSGNARTFNRTGILVLTAGAGARTGVHPLTVIGEAKLSDGAVLRREARGPGVAVEVAGATAQGVVDRQRAVTAPWLGLDLPAGFAPPPPAGLEVKQTSVTRMAEGDRYEFEFTWSRRNRAVRLPGKVDVQIVGARDIRVTNMTTSQAADPGAPVTGTFVVTTTKATDPARYDLYLAAEVDMMDGQEVIVSRPIPFLVTERSQPANAASTR